MTDKTVQFKNTAGKIVEFPETMTVKELRERGITLEFSPIEAPLEPDRFYHPFPEVIRPSSQ